MVTEVINVALSGTYEMVIRHRDDARVLEGYAVH